MKAFPALSSTNLAVMNECLFAEKQTLKMKTDGRSIWPGASRRFYLDAPSPQSKQSFPKLGLFNLNSVTVVCSWPQAHLTLLRFSYSISCLFSCWLHLARINLLVDRWASSFRFELGQPNTVLSCLFKSLLFSIPY